MNDTFFQFKCIAEDLLDQMTSGEVWPVLLLTVPFYSTLRGYIHPLTTVVHGFMHREAKLTEKLPPEDDYGENPRIVFINLDGRDSYFNLKALKQV